MSGVPRGVAISGRLTVCSSQSGVLRRKTLTTLAFVIDVNIAEPVRDIPAWNETRWNGIWSPEQGVGLYLHAGRLRADLDMWWAQVLAYLPGRELVVDRFYGRNPNELGVRFGGFDLSMTDDGWTSTFDGVGQMTTTDEMAVRPAGSSWPMRTFAFDVTAQNRTPVWDMYGDRQQTLRHGDAHIQQTFDVTGTIAVGDRTWTLTNAIGFKDHSSGPREIEGWFGHRFFLIVAADWVCHAVVMYTADGEPMPALGAFFRGSDTAGVTGFDLPDLADSAGGPVHGDARIELSTGETLNFASELVHAAPMLMTTDNDYVNGIDWERDGDPIVLIEGNGRLEAADGTVAHCFHERTARRSNVTRPAPALTS